ncbi:hypothetical protein GGP66_000663 [Salinibacter ruber]|nr:hypothetical protein [Salinibacter ruber]MCS3610587.1 hypothetical protein [Salinibacter ruber]MCS3614569.1 hypothetical protein [Salinibacter ruber]MCS3645479.1 hypothetical protein [Salinibacter ruber]MCS3673251.1 hypothetical protein [Salinibacter ruber]
MEARLDVEGDGPAGPNVNAAPHGGADSGVRGPAGGHVEAGVQVKRDPPVRRAEGVAPQQVGRVPPVRVGRGGGVSHRHVAAGLPAQGKAPAWRQLVPQLPHRHQGKTTYRIGTEFLGRTGPRARQVAGVAREAGPELAVEPVVKVLGLRGAHDAREQKRDPEEHETAAPRAGHVETAKVHDASRLIRPPPRMGKPKK